jgi:hypothetical protein
MKLPSLAVLIALTLLPALRAADKEDHDHKTQAGPTGGRLITKVEPHAEFFVNKENRIEIRFVDDENRVLAPGEQVVTVTMGDRAAPSRLAFAKEGDKLVSDKPIPAGRNLPTVVQIRASPGAKTELDRFNLDLSQCPTCDYKEYACICGHDHEEEK